MRKPHNRIDVSIFKELTKKKYYSETIISKKALLKKIEHIHNSEVTVNGFNINKQREIDKINVAEFGFKEFDDIKFEFTQDVFNNNTRIRLLPTKVYELDDVLDIPGTDDSCIQAYRELLSDSVERIKIKAEHVLSETDEIHNIELYAKKNILMGHKVFSDTIIFLEKAQRKNDRSEILIAFIQNVYIINIINYLHELFGAFYSDNQLSKKTLRNELYEVINLKTFLELNKVSNYSFKGAVLEKGAMFQWNGQINSLVTLFYDLMHDTLPNEKFLLEAGIDDLKFILTNFFTDKNGSFIKEKTIDTYMKEYRDEKRAKGKNRIDIIKYEN